MNVLSTAPFPNLVCKICTGWFVITLQLDGHLVRRFLHIVCKEKKCVEPLFNAVSAIVINLFTCVETC